MKKLKQIMNEALALNNFSGLTDTNEKITIDQNSNGMFSAQLEDKHHSISATTAKTMKDIWDWIGEHGIKEIKWDDGKISKIKK